MVFCPVHNNGRKILLNFSHTKKYQHFGKIESCFCEKCKKYYIYNKNMESGFICKTKGYDIVNLHKDTFFPNQFFVLEKKDLKELGRSKELIDINKFYKDDNSTYQIPAKFDKLNNKYYITSGTYKHCSKVLKQLNIMIIKNTSCEIKNKSVNSMKISENLMQYEKEIDEHQNNLDSLKKNSKIAVAYQSANILYNPYQYLPWLYIFNENVQNILISDEVGLGKTIEAGILIAEELHCCQANKILIICPAFLRNKWKQELKDKFFLDASIYNEHENDTNILIVPLSRLKQFDENNHQSFTMLVVDEVHYFKNNQSARYQYLNDFIRKNNPYHKIFMSATPINNSGNDFRSIKNLFVNDFVKTNTSKKQAYINIKKRYVHEIYVDLNSDEQEVYDVTDFLNPFSGTIYRHIGASCLYALKKYAEKYTNNESDVKTELRNSLEELFNSDYDDIDENIDEIESFADNLLKLSLSKNDSKLEKLINLIDKITDNKIVIFSHYIETVKYLKSELSFKYNCEYVYANNFSNHKIFTNKKDRFIDAKKWFHEQSSDCKTILICSDSCKEGIDLDEASCLINYDLPFNPSIVEQRIGRIDRMCQKQDMNIYNFHVNKTYDDRLHLILSYKLLIINYYSEYGIGNPLAIVENDSDPFDKFISYFKKNKFPMTNDDLSVIKKILNKINVQVNKKVTSNEILNLLISNKNNIIDLFNDDEISELTNEQLYLQKQQLDAILGFPKHNSGKLFFSETVKKNICTLIKNQPFLKSKLSSIIINYDQKLKAVEDTGNPMIVEENDITSDILFTSNTEGNSNFISAEIVKILEEQGAELYANK